MIECNLPLPFKFGEDAPKKKDRRNRPKNFHPVYLLKVGQSYKVRDQKDSLVCSGIIFNCKKRRNWKMKRKNGIITRIE